MKYLNNLLYLCLKENIRFYFIILFFICLPCNYSYSDDKNSLKELQKLIFNQDISKVGCKNLIQDEYTNLENIKIFNEASNFILKDLENTLSLVFKSLKKQDSKTLSELFHPRLDVKEETFRYIMFKDLPKVYGIHIKYKIAYFFALNTPGGYSNLISCNQNIKILPHYGYDIQFAVLVDMIGDKEDGKIYFTIVPYKSSWKIGVWKLKQWSFLKQNPSVWFDDGIKDLKTNNRFLAYLKFSLASKLAHGEGYYYFNILEQSLNEKKALFDKKDFLENLKTFAKNQNIFDVDSLFLEKGFGVSFRINVLKNEELSVLNTQCVEVYKNILNVKEFLQIEGIKCSFILNTDDKTQKELANFIITKSDLK